MSKPVAGDEAVKRLTLTEFGFAGGKRTGSNAPSSGQQKAQELEQLREKAYQEGFNKGSQDGLAAAREHIEALQQQLQYTLSLFEKPLQQYDEVLERELVQLAVSVAKQIVRRELKTDPGQVIAVVREAVLALSASAQNIKVYLHPDDAEIVRKVLLSGDEERAWSLVEDPVLQRGGCRVMTDSSDVDATIEGRVAAIAANILGGEREDDG